MKQLKQQRGMTLVGWLVVLALIGFFAMLAMRLGPIYMENYTIKMALESMENEPGLADKTPGQVRGFFQKRMDMNYVTRLSQDSVKIRREEGVTHLEVDYEVREPMIGNIDVVVTFKEKAELSRH